LSDRALSGVRVLDLTNYIAGPYCTKLLADFGAEVIKVERPRHGDGLRTLGPFPRDIPDPEKSGLFLYLNTNKRGITLDLGSPRGREVFMDLVRQCDILVESFEPRVMAGWGLDYEHLLRANPKLVMTSISNFGQTGPYRDYRATEIVLYALGGLMYISGSYDREPVKHGLTQGQYLAGTFAAVATMAALRGARIAGSGSYIDVSIMEAVQSAMLGQTSYYSGMGAVERRQGKIGSVLGEVMPAQDGYIVPMLIGPWDNFVTFMDIPELGDPKFATPAGRTTHASELKELLLSNFRGRSKHELFQAGQEWRYSFGIVQDSADLAACPHLNSRGYFIEADSVRMPGAPFKMGETPWSLRQPAPHLGEHNDEIFHGLLKMPVADVQALKDARVL